MFFLFVVRLSKHFHNRTLSIGLLWSEARRLAAQQIYQQCGPDRPQQNQPQSTYYEASILKCIKRSLKSQAFIRRRGSPASPCFSSLLVQRACNDNLLHFSMLSIDTGLPLHLLTRHVHMSFLLFSCLCLCFFHIFLLEHFFYGHSRCLPMSRSLEKSSLCNRPATSHRAKPNDDVKYQQQFILKVHIHMSARAAWAPARRCKQNWILSSAKTLIFMNQISNIYVCIFTVYWNIGTLEMSNKIIYSTWFTLFMTCVYM